MKQTFCLLFFIVLLTGYALYGSRRATPSSRAASPSPAPAATPEIISRKEWKAKDPVGGAKEHAIRRITIHHTGTPQNQKLAVEKKMQNLQNFSQRESPLASGRMKPAWFDVPYHYYVASDGRIAEGREIKYVGDTNTGYDPTGHALVVLEGNFETEQPTAAQVDSLEELTAWLALKWKVPAAEVKAHNDYAATACPGANLKALLPALRQKIERLGEKPGGGGGGS